MNRRHVLMTIGSLSISGCLRLTTQNNGNRTETEFPTNSPSGNTISSPSPSKTKSLLQSETQRDGENESPTATQTDTQIDPSISTDWPQYRFDHGRAGYNPDTTGPTGEVTSLWTFSRQEDVPTAREDKSEFNTFNPIIYDGFVYVASQDDNVYAINAETGEEAWRFSVDTSTTDPIRKATPVAGNGLVISEGSGGHLYALTHETGDLEWQVRLNVEEGHPQPALAGNTVFLAIKGTVYAFDSTDGSTKWTREDTGWPNSLSVGPKRVFVTAAEDPDPAQRLYALDRQTGDTHWTIDGPSITSSVGNGTIVTGRKTPWQEETQDMDGPPLLYAIDPTDGSVRWKITVPAPYGSETTSPSIANGMLFIGLDDGNIYAYDIENGERKWKFTTRGESIQEMPVVVENHLYFGTFWPGIVYCIGIEEGTRKWSYPLPKSAHQPAVVDNVVYITDQSGRIHALTGTKK